MRKTIIVLETEVEVLQVEITKIKKMIQELAKRIEVQEQTNTLVEPESPQSRSNVRKNDSRGEIQNSILDQIISEIIRVLNKEKSQK